MLVNLSFALCPVDGWMDGRTDGQSAASCESVCISCVVRLWWCALPITCYMPDNNSIKYVSAVEYRPSTCNERIQNGISTNHYWPCAVTICGVVYMLLLLCCTVCVCDATQNVTIMHVQIPCTLCCSYICTYVYICIWVRIYGWTHDRFVQTFHIRNEPVTIGVVEIAITSLYLFYSICVHQYRSLPYKYDTYWHNNSAIQQNNDKLFVLDYDYLI